MMRDIDDTAKADALLMEHYYWQKSWRPPIGYGSAAPECRYSLSSRQWDSEQLITNEQIERLEMESVEWCINALPQEFRHAIGAEMVNRERNRVAKASVWRPNTKRTYTEAVAAIIPFMRKRSLI